MTLVETLRWLVDIPSETGDEERIRDAITERLAMHDVTVIGKSAVIGERTGRPLILLVGHLDTVPSQGQPPARIQDGRLHGLGATDMKGGLAVMIHLLEGPDIARYHYDVVGVFYEAEEGPAEGNGLEPILKQESWLADATFAVVLEPSDRELQVGCNGVINATVRFVGRSSHSARPWWGENAVTKAGSWLSAMHDRQPELFVIDGLEYREVMSVTMAGGGVARNIIPPSFDLNLNYRFNPRRSVEEAIEMVRTACAAADEVHIVDSAPAGPVEAGHPFLHALRAVSGADLAAKQGWTDVARLGAYGVPGVNFGPGEAKQAHQAEESVLLDDLDFTYDALRAALAKGLSSD